MVVVMIESRPHAIVPTVLLVEDNPDELSADCRIIGSRFPVLSATCGSDALYSARQALPTVIVLDVMMPGRMNGFDFLHELSTDPLTRDIPVIFLSAANRTRYLSFNIREIGRRFGNEPVAFLEKPASPERLLQAVTEASVDALARSPHKGHTPDDIHHSPIQARQKMFRHSRQTFVGIGWGRLQSFF